MVDFPELSSGGRGSYYVLTPDHQVRRVDSLMEWAEAFERGNRKVDTTLVGKTRVSTVFLGLDHNHDLFGPPLLFETMVFGGPMDQHQVRYGSYEEAQLGHAAVVSEVVSMQQPWPMFKFRCRQLWNKTKRFLRDYW